MLRAWWWLLGPEALLGNRFTLFCLHLKLYVYAFLRRLSHSNPLCHPDHSCIRATALSLFLSNGQTGVFLFIKSFAILTHWRFQLFLWSHIYAMFSPSRVFAIFQSHPHSLLSLEMTLVLKKIRMRYYQLEHIYHSFSMQYSVQMYFYPKKYKK